MSIKPYNNFFLRDLSNVQQPYINSTTEYGYFNGISVGRIATGLWDSLPAVLNTNNGIANVAANGGLRILNAGIYSINLSLSPTSTQDASSNLSSNISFNFGTTYLLDVPSTTQVNSFGGVRSTGMFTYDSTNNPSFPGIITWVATGYSSGTNITNNFVKTQTNELSYRYFNAGYQFYPLTFQNALYGGICTTEMTFIINSPTTIFFNVSTNSTTGITMSNCFFTLELISTYSLPPIILWTPRTNSGVRNWTSIASNSTGQNLAAVADGNTIYTSDTSGNSWTPRFNGLPGTAYWRSITSNSTGEYLAAVVYGGTIYRSINYGADWTTLGTSNGLPSQANWDSIASDSTGQYLAAVVDNGTIYTSINYGANWSARNTGSNPAPTAASWRSIASSSRGDILAAVVVNGTIYTSFNYGLYWTELGTSNGLPATASWRSIASNSTGEYLAAVVNGGTIYRSINYGADWTTLGTSNGLPSQANWTSIASDSTGQYLAAVVDNGTIYTSINYGATWTAQTNGLPASANWQSIASSSSGANLAAVATNSVIYTGANS